MNYVLPCTETMDALKIKENFNGVEYSVFSLQEFEIGMTQCDILKAESTEYEFNFYFTASDTGVENNICKLNVLKF